jgi:hypothetical protein
MCGKITEITDKCDNFVSQTGGEDDEQTKAEPLLTGPLPHSVALMVSALDPHNTDPAAPHTAAGRMKAVCKSALSSNEIQGVTSPA